ncbi:MAG: hypothetical protein KC635_27000, partial [Myxococcales bacterium]|nr:hypothetical protein [Myxococcales bacterium]
AIATASWWKEERHGVFLDYNQNAKDRTTASVYSVRPREDARVSCPLRWDEVATCDPAAFTVRTMPARLAAVGDVEAGMDEAVGRLDGLLALSDEQAAAGAADAPWPPHYEKKDGEPPRVQPSRAKKKAASGDGDGGDESGAESPTGRRRSRFPLLVIAKAQHKEEAEAGLARWKARYPKAAALLHVDDVLVDSMRGRSSTWTRIRVNLRHVPVALRPPKEAPDPDYDPWHGYKPPKRGDTPVGARRPRGAAGAGEEEE